MKKIIEFILFISIITVIILSLPLLFIEVPKTKKILDIQTSITNIEFKMPKGTHFNPYLVVDKDSMIEGNITIRDGQTIIYSGKINKTFLLKNETAYSLIPINRIESFFKQNKKYGFKIHVKKKNKYIRLELSWLDCSLCGYLQ